MLASTDYVLHDAERSEVVVIAFGPTAVVSSQIEEGDG
jgi:hypothetical protein